MEVHQCGSTRRTDGGERKRTVGRRVKAAQAHGELTPACVQSSAERNNHQRNTFYAMDCYQARQRLMHACTSELDLEEKKKKKSLAPSELDLANPSKQNG